MLTVAAVGQMLSGIVMEIEIDEPGDNVLPEGVIFIPFTPLYDDIQGTSLWLFGSAVTVSEQNQPIPALY
ncbi:MAG: hypothetical protein NVSMB38_42440 [Ktedonobacteraceae bacterium]